MARISSTSPSRPVERRVVAVAASRTGPRCRRTAAFGVRSTTRSKISFWRCMTGQRSFSSARSGGRPTPRARRRRPRSARTPRPDPRSPPATRAADLGHGLTTGRLEALVVVLADHHDHQVGPVRVLDLLHRRQPVEVVEPRQAGGDAALPRRPHEGRIGTRAPCTSRGLRQRVADHDDAQLVLRCRARILVSRVDRLVGWRGRRRAGPDRRDVVGCSTSRAPGAASGSLPRRSTTRRRSPRQLQDVAEGRQRARAPTATPCGGSRAAAPPLRAPASGRTGRPTRAGRRASR